MDVCELALMGYSVHGCSVRRGWEEIRDCQLAERLAQVIYCINHFAEHEDMPEACWEHRECVLAAVYAATLAALYGAESPGGGGPSSGQLSLSVNAK